MTQADEGLDQSGLEPEQAQDIDQQTDNLEADSAPSESSPDGGENHEQKIEFSEEQQGVVNKIVGEKTFKLREAERKAQQEREQLQAEIDKLRQQVPQEERPQVPQYPDRYDFDSDADFQRAVQERDQAVQQAAAWDGRQQALREQQESDRLKQQQEAAKRTADAAQSYTQKAQTLGITPEELRQAGDRVAAYGVSEDLAMTILGDDDGPLITTYLANNVEALDAVSRANPMQAGLLLAKIKNEAVKLKPKLPGAPAPSDHIQGGGTPPKERGPRGATFE